MRHHFDIATKAAGPSRAPEPNFVKIEKIFPRMMAKAGFSRAEIKDPITAITMVGVCCRVVKTNKDRHEGLPPVASAIETPRNAVVDPSRLSVGAGI